MNRAERRLRHWPSGESSSLRAASILHWRRLLPTLACVFGLPTGVIAGSGVSGVDVPLDGRAIALPLSAGFAGSCRLEISGTFRCDIDGRAYDAVYRTDPGGHFTLRHGLLVIEPPMPLAEEDRRGHRYVFAPPVGFDATDTAVTVRLDMDTLVREFLRTPSEVRQSLSGGLKATLTVMPPAQRAGALLAALAPWLLGVILVTAGAVTVYAMHRARQRLGGDIRAMLARITRKCKAALEEIGTDEGLFAELRQRVRSLREGADELARHVLVFRRAELRHSEAEIQAEIARLETERRRAQAPDIMQRCDEAIAAKRQSLEYLRANRENEARYLLRLTNVETTLDNLRLKLPQLRVRLAETGADRAAIAEVDAELGLLRSAIEELRKRTPGVSPL